MKLSLKEFFLREGDLNEYEDPTSSKNDDSSKWSSPLSHKEGVPSEVPQSDGQERSSDAWQDAECASETEHSPGGEKCKHSDLKKFFGGDHHPVREDGDDAESEEGGEPSSNKEFQVDLTPPTDEPTDEPDQLSGEPDLSGWMQEFPGAADALIQILQTAGAGEGEEQGEPEEMGDFGPPPDDDGFGGDEPEEEMDEAPFASPRVNRWAHTSKKPKDGPVAKFQQAKDSKKSSNADAEKKFWDSEPQTEGFDEATGDDDEEAFLKSLEGPGEPQAGAPGSQEPEIDWGQLDDQGFIDQLASMDPQPTGGKKKEKPRTITDPGEEVSWDEFRATNPDEAQEAELKIPEGELAGATFKKKKSGFLTATTASGRRLFYMGDQRGWMDMDDGSSPAGEF